MRPKVLIAVATVAVAFLLATNPVVVHAAGMITGKQIKNGSITGKDVKDSSLLATDFKAGELPMGPVGPTGATGATGAPGAAGPQGAPGGPGLSGYVIVSQSDSYNASFSMTVPCPGTKKAIGGGHNWTSGQIGVWFWQDGPAEDGSGWVVRGNVDRSGAASDITAYAVCANVG